MGKGDAVKSWPPEVDLQVPLGRRRVPAPESCPPTSTRALRHVCVCTRTGECVNT